MAKDLNNVFSELSNVYLKHDKLQRVVNDVVAVSQGDFKAFLQQLQQFHADSAKEIRDILETLPDIPVHQSFNETSTFGLPMKEYSLTDLQSRNESYRQSALYEAEVALRKYYQDALMNLDAPDNYKKVFQQQIESLTNFMEPLEQYKQEVQD